MIDYDPKHWWGGVLAWRGTVWPAIIGRTLGLIGLTFLDDPNDLPLEEICGVIERDATQIAAAARE